MDRTEILAALKVLSHNQGFYTKLYNQVKDDEIAMRYLESKNFKDPVDLILFLEQ